MDVHDNTGIVSFMSLPLPFLPQQGLAPGCVKPVSKILNGISHSHQKENGTSSSRRHLGTSSYMVLSQSSISQLRHLWLFISYHMYMFLD